MFRIPGSGDHLIGSWDLHTTKFQRLRFKKTPKLTKTTKGILDFCCKSEHLVESRKTGETFLVKQYDKTANIIDGIARMKTEAVMVFKVDDKGNAVYTRNIGDLCILLTKSEHFCVPSCSFSVTDPNSVQVWEVDRTNIFVLDSPVWHC